MKVWLAIFEFGSDLGGHRDIHGRDGTTLATFVRARCIPAASKPGAERCPSTRVRQDARVVGVSTLDVGLAARVVTPETDGQGQVILMQGGAPNSAPSFETTGRSAIGLTGPSVQ